MFEFATGGNICDQFGHPNILVVGDLILDRYTFGNAERISPEAPVVVLRVDSKEVRLGGAASVAMLLRGLGADVTLAGVVGDDPEGRILRSLLQDEKIDCHLVFSDPDRQTTTKERIIGRAANRHSHQIVRVDHESREPVSSAVEQRLTEGLAHLCNQPAGAAVIGHSPRLNSKFGSILIADYSKGVCTSNLLRRIIQTGRESQIHVIVDPARIVDYSRYAGATLLKPNRTEAALATGCAISNATDALQLAQHICSNYELEAAIITLDSEGIVLAQRDGATEHFPCVAREVYDITGAGDMVLATLGLCLAADIPLSHAVQVSNVAAGLEIARLGVAPVTRGELSSALERNLTVTPSDHFTTKNTLSPTQSSLDSSAITSLQASSCKITTFSSLLSVVDEHRRRGKTIIFTNGCFDLLHVGHVGYLQEAAALGDFLVVAVNSDASVRSLKGSGRPVIGEQDRATMLAALSCVDRVILFDDETPLQLLQRLRPEVLVKGGTTVEVVGREIVESYGGRVCRVGPVAHASTTAIISQLGSHRPMAPSIIGAPLYDSAVPFESLATSNVRNERNHV